MQTQRELLEDARERFAAKLEGLTAYAEELAERVEAHDPEEAHFEDDLVKARHDAQFYADQIAWIDGRLASGDIEPPLGVADAGTRPAREPGGVPLAWVPLAFLAGALLGSRLRR